MVLTEKVNISNVAINVETKVQSTSENTHLNGTVKSYANIVEIEPQRPANQFIKRRIWCQTSQMNPRPTFEEWLVEQDYDKLLWEYKQVLKELLDKNKPGDKISNQTATNT